MSTRDPEATKERILAAALHEFSAKGISGARRRHRGTRQGQQADALLLLRVEGRAVPRDPPSPARRTPEPPGDLDHCALDRFACSATRSTCGSSCGKRSRRRPVGPRTKPSRRDFFRSWIETVEAEQAAGNLPDDLDPAQLVLSELLLVIGPVALPQLTRLVTGRSVNDPDFLADRVEFLDRLERHITAPAAVRD